MEGDAPRNARIRASQAEPDRAAPVTLVPMKECWIRALAAHRREIRWRWEALLRLERTDSPIADPDNLVHLIDWTLERVFAQLRRRRTHNGGVARPTIAALRAGCQCGHNPYLNHFLAGEQALIEALVLAQAHDPSLDPAHRDIAVAELYLVMHTIARSEVESVCSLCQRYPHPRTQTPFPAAAAAS